MKTLYYKSTGVVIGAEPNPQETEEIGVTEAVCSQSYLIACFNVEDEVFYEGASPEQIRSHQMAQTKLKYEFHRKNGWNAYQDFRALIVQDIAEGKISELQAFQIEKDLKVAYDRISQNGDWKTGYFELSLVVPSASFVDEYYHLAMNFIAQYINQNYEQ